LSCDDCLKDEERLSELFSAVLCTTIVHSYLYKHTHMSSSSEKTRLQNDLLCVERDVKLYSLTHSSACLHMRLSIRDVMHCG